MLRLAGKGIKLTGAQVDGNGPAIDAMGNNTGRGEGIRVVGSDCQLVDCRASNMPDGSVANCFYIAGENSSVYRCLLYTSPSPRDRQKSRMPSSA